MRPFRGTGLPDPGDRPLSRNAGERPTFVFETTTAALWGEEVAQERGIPVELVPAPAASRAKCDLALVTLPARGEELAGALEEEGVPAARWS